MKFDTFLAIVGDWGRFQKVKYTLICLTYMLPSIMVYTYTFTAATPDFRCAYPDIMSTDQYRQSSNTSSDSKYKPTEVQCNAKQKGISIKECQRCYIQSGNGTLETCNHYVYDRTYHEKTLVEEVGLENKNIFYKYLYFLIVVNGL